MCKKILLILKILAIKKTFKNLRLRDYSYDQISKVKSQPAVLDPELYHHLRSAVPV